MKGLANALRTTPRGILVFGVFHLTIGVIALGSLFASRCVDPPSAAGMAYLDGCSLIYDPWQEGDWPYLLAIYLSFVVSSYLILRAQRVARWVLLLAIVAWFAYALLMGVDMTKEALERDMTPGVQRSWVGAWTEALENFGSVTWIVLASWVTFDAWFLFSHARAYFRKGA